MKLDTYKNYLQKHGNNLSEVKKKQSDYIIDRTFTRDPNYKRVYILTKDGWKYEDVKYQFHSASSILKDAVDYYVQFRPGVHYPIGSYIIIPDDPSNELNLTEEELENPFKQDVSNRTQWWLIVGRNNATSYVRYMVLKCNWNFKWILNGKILEVFGCIRNANSYTSGAWTADYSTSLDNLSGCWIPDTHYIYSDKLSELGLCDTRTIHYDQRFMITNNIINPKCYRVTKVVDMVPQGIIKLSIKQDDFDPNRDCPELMLCNYYEEEGMLNVDIDSTDTGENSIVFMTVDENFELVESSEEPLLQIGKSSYFKSEIDSPNVIEWDIHIVGDYSDDENDYYCNLIKITRFDNTTVSVKPSKAGSIIGKRFNLSVCDTNGDYYSSIELEVKE